MATGPAATARPRSHGLVLQRLSRQGPEPGGARRPCTRRSTRCGAGSGGTRNISGTTHYHVELEAELADLHGKEAALLFTSGYVSNEATLATLQHDPAGLIIFSDALNHASMIAGIRHGGAAKHIFRHNDLAHLEELLPADPGDAPKLIAFESVYSMDGDIADLPAPVRRGRALRRHDLSGRSPCGRACTASAAAGVAERDGVMRPDRHHRRHAGQGVRRDGRLYRRHRPRCSTPSAPSAPGFIFTTSLPPALAAGALASVRWLQGSTTSARAPSGTRRHPEAPLRRTPACR